MKSLGLVFVGLLCLCVALMYWAWSLNLPPQNAEPARISPAQGEGYRIRSNQFKRDQEGEQNLLSYFWWDFRENPFTAVFSLSQATVQESDLEFGYYPTDMDAYVNPRTAPLQEEMLKEMRNVVIKLITKSRYGHYFYIEQKDAVSFNLKIVTPPSVSAEEQKRIKTEFQKVVRSLAKKQAPYIKRIQAEELKIKQEFLATCGLRVEGRSLLINYAWVIERNRERVVPVVASLRRESEGKSLKDFLSMLLAFVQSMGYGTPPLDDAEKIILGFWPPPKVLVNNYGDCDSKAVVFGSLWGHFTRYPLLLIRIPRHLFIGVAIPSFQREQFTINGLRYTFCEVSGPDLVPPGIISPLSRIHLENGGFHYELIR